MTEEFLKHGKESTFRDRSRGGLFTKFLIQYNKEFGVSKLNPSCPSCRRDYWNKYLKLFEMKKKVQCSYTLHEKYNGISLNFGGRPIRNGEMTNEQAKELLNKHPHGAKLFSVIPELIEIKEVVNKEVKEVVKKKKTKKK